MDKWYYAWNGEKLGPVSLHELQMLADEDALQSQDLVWTSGMKDWQPAGNVSVLKFPEEPPPLPDSQRLQPLFTGPWDETAQGMLHWLWAHKSATLFLGLLVGGTALAVLANMRAPEIYMVVISVPTMICFLGMLIVGLYSAGQFLSACQRRCWLQQKWESTSGDGRWIQFSADGGFVRHDGLGAKFTFHPKEDRIELRPIGEAEPIQLKVVMLSEKELALNWDGQTLHFQKPSWWRKLFG